MGLLQVIFSLTLILLPLFCRAEVSMDKPIYAQLLVGNLHLLDDRVTLTREGELYDGKLRRLPYIGGAAQMLWRDDWLEYGWEGGGFVTWINDRVDYFARSDSRGLLIKISVDNVFWSLETFMGLYLSVHPAPPIRLYLSGGPLAIYAVARKSEPLETRTVSISTVTSVSRDINRGSDLVIDLSNKDTDLNFGGYARVGIELNLTNNLWAGVSLRYMKTDLNLSSSLGQFSIDGALLQFSLTQQL